MSPHSGGTALDLQVALLCCWDPWRVSAWMLPPESEGRGQEGDALVLNLYGALPDLSFLLLPFFFFF